MPSAPHSTGPVPDERQIDALVGEFFRCFDNRAGRTPEAHSMTRLFAPGAAVSVHKGAVPELCTAEQFAAPRVQLLTQGRLTAFHEWELAARTTVLGPIATRTCSYAKAGCLDGSDFTGTGTKVFQLVKLEAQWRILALSWFDDP